MLIFKKEINTATIISIIATVIIPFLVFLFGNGVLMPKPNKEPVVDDKLAINEAESNPDKRNPEHPVGAAESPSPYRESKIDLPISSTKKPSKKARYNFPDPYQIYDFEFSIMGIFGTESGIIAEFKVINHGPKRTIIIFADNTRVSDPENRNQFSLLTTNQNQLRASNVKFGSAKSAKYGKVSLRSHQTMTGQIEFEKVGVSRNESLGINLRCWADDVKEFDISFPQVRQL